MRPFVWTYVICALYVLFAVGRPRIGRVLFGVTYLLTALFNAVVTSRAPETIFTYGLNHTFLLWYGDLLRKIALPHPLLWVLVVGVGWEALAGILLLSRGAAVKAGIVAAVLLNVAIAPLAPEIAIGNMLLAAGELSLLPYRYEFSVLDMFARRRAEA